MELTKGKRGYVFVLLILSKRILFNICVLSQCIVYGIRFQNIHTFTYQKTLLHTRFLFLKFLEVLSVSLRTTVIAKPLTSGILFSTSPIFVFKTAIVTKPLMSGILFLISPIFISKFCYLCCIGLFELK